VALVAEHAVAVAHGVRGLDVNRQDLNLLAGLGVVPAWVAAVGHPTVAFLGRPPPAPIPGLEACHFRHSAARLASQPAIGRAAPITMSGCGQVGALAAWPSVQSTARTITAGGLITK
jgi:hypothetical protein